MLVLISDLHLTDGTSGETIKPGAFELFTFQLVHMAQKAEAREIDIVFLGDILDVIRSEKWLQSDIRPWSEETHRDGHGKFLEDYVYDIVNGICSNSTNTQSMKHLAAFKAQMEEKGISVSFTYITGNHDWLINRYPEVRAKAAEFLCISDPAKYNSARFAEEGYWDRYDVFARHGDIYDSFNYDGNRDASSLGDAIVIDLLNKFPAAVENDIGNAEDPDLIRMLKEIDNIRPLSDVPLWIYGVCRQARSASVADRVKKVWDDLAGKFCEIDFVKRHNKRFKFDAVDGLLLCLRLTRLFPLKYLAKLPSWLRSGREDNYALNAVSEERMHNSDAQFVVYGHTHNHVIEPLDRGKVMENKLGRIYFNTGTWRKVHVKMSLDRRDQMFSGWHVMTFLAFYLDNERRDNIFEIWNGALG